VYARVATVHAAGRFAAGDIGGAGPLDCCLARMQEAAGWPLLWEVTARHCDSLPYLPRQWMRLKARLARRLACRPSAPSHAHTCHSTSHGEVR
jgi:hypothetical protein